MKREKAIDTSSNRDLRLKSLIVLSKGLVNMVRYFHLELSNYTCRNGGISLDARTKLAIPIGEAAQDLGMIRSKLRK